AQTPCGICASSKPDKTIAPGACCQPAEITGFPPDFNRAGSSQIGGCVPQRLKPHFGGPLAARLKPCPAQNHSFQNRFAECAQELFVGILYSASENALPRWLATKSGAGRNGRQFKN